MLRWLFLLLIFTTTVASAQSPAAKADSLYRAKNYAQAAPLYLEAASLAEFRNAGASHYYNAACCYALTGDKKNAFSCLAKARSLGYNNREHVMKDTDLESLHDGKQWKKLLRSMKEEKTWSDDPMKAKLVTTDITNFWDAYDRAQKDTANRLAIYKEYYIAKGSPGLQDYFAMKVGNMRSFVRGHDKKEKFYAAIRQNTLQLEAQKPRMIQSFVRFKELYPDARFPAIVFVIGNWTSGGTASNNGLLIGADQYMKSPDIPLDELNLWEKNNFGLLEHLPNIIAHELIHFNQSGLAQDTTLLAAAIKEGMADFFAELISGRTANQRIHEWARGKEGQIWTDFKKEMYLARARNWIGNANQETPDHPADLGYWIGYTICKAYYDRAADKQLAVREMLNIKDFRAFYEKSGVEASLASSY